MTSFLDLLRDSVGGQLHMYVFCTSCKKKTYREYLGYTMYSCYSPRNFHTCARSSTATRRHGLHDILTCVLLDISRTHSLVASGSHTPFLRRPRASCGASTRSHNTPLRADLLEEHADAYAAQSSPSSKKAQGGKFHQLSGDFHHNLVILVAGGIYRSRRRKYDVRREHFVFASGRSRCHRHQRPCSLLTRS